MTMTRQELLLHPAVRNYRLFCLAALFVLVVCLSDRGLEWWCLVPPLIGSLTLLTHWKQGPPLVLLSLAGLLGVSGLYPRWSYRPGLPHFQAPTLTDFLLCIAVLAYVVGQYRILSLTRCIFPSDPRPRTSGERRGVSPPVQQGPKGPEGPEGRQETNQRTNATPLATREPDLVTVREMTLLWMALPVWGGMGGLLWAWVIDYSPPLDMPRELWQVLRLVWTCLAVLAAAGTVASYLRRTTATPEESLLYLQDQCWRQTRREQSILNRWLTWARLRAQRKKELS